MRYPLLLLLILLGNFLFAQRLDSLITDSVSGQKVMAYKLGDQWLLYRKPKPFKFLTQLPRTFKEAAVESFSKKSLPAWGAIAGSTVALLMFDQLMLDGVQQFSGYINMDNERVYNHALEFNLCNKNFTIYEVPGNLNSAVYQIGEGLPSLLIAGGLALYGNIKNDYRSRSTANQMLQTFIVMGVTTQFMKRIFGRESPFVATVDGGRWRPFPNWGTYQKAVPHYDAFPSGHMATLMATVVVISSNYPEKRWIKPVGYSIMGMVGMAMINNGVHWASDYPLAIGLGYVVGKVTVNMNRWVRGETKNRHHFSK
jgi:PAP2 superfamily